MTFKEIEILNFITSNTKDLKSILSDRPPVINANNLIKIMKAGN